jgi:hypothetical protein
MSRTLKLVLAANLAVVAILAFVYAEFMVAPGKLIPGHHKIQGDCFACHTAFRGATAERCITCHTPEEIGRRTTTGAPIAKPLAATPFHQRLAKQDCVACHSDHSGVKRFRKEGRFDHNMLTSAERQACEGCHRTPTDTIHRQVTGKCTACHAQDRWKPATYDHNKYFPLVGDHKAECVTCHERNDYSRYTCYGCHEHSRPRLWAEHVEEGIRDFDNCLECHKGGRKHGGYRGHDEEEEHDD